MTVKNFENHSHCLMHYEVMNNFSDNQPAASVIRDRTSRDVMLLTYTTLNVSSMYLMILNALKWRNNNLLSALLSLYYKCSG